MTRKTKKLTRAEALKKAKHMAKSYIGAGTPKVAKVRGKNAYEYVFPIRGRKGNIVGYGVGTVRPTMSSGSSISKRQADLLRRKQKKRKKR